MRELTNHQRSQLAQFGIPFISTVEQRQRAVLDVSVYNVLSHGRADRSAAEVVAVLQTAWAKPPWAGADTIDRRTVMAAAERLQRLRLVVIDGDTIRIPLRDPNGHGTPVEVDYFEGRVRSKNQ